MLSLHLVPECYAETELVKIIFNPIDYLNHAEGIHAVSTILKRQDIQNYINIGFIDNDKKNIPPYFDEFIVIDELPSIILKKHPITNDYVFVANPAIEKFIITQLSEINKNPSDYELPNDFKGFRKKLKSMRIEHNHKYKEMISDLKNANTSGILFMLRKTSELQNQSK
jgi:hypothetical protein